MFRNLDFSSWQTVVTSLIGLVAITVLMVGLRLLMMLTIQQRREREKRQINERLRVLIAAYKTLGGSFTGDLVVDPTHVRDLQRRLAEEGAAMDNDTLLSSDRSQRIRDAVEGALSDIILLGTEDQVRLAAHAAAELAAGKFVHTHELVVSLRDFIRQVLDLEPVPADLTIPRQGPARPGGGGKGKGGDDDRGKAKGDGGAAMGAGLAGGGMGLGVGGGLSIGRADYDEDGPR